MRMQFTAAKWGNCRHGNIETNDEYLWLKHCTCKEPKMHQMQVRLAIIMHKYVHSLPHRCVCSVSQGFCHVAYGS